MSSQALFTSRVLCYCLGMGELRLRGRRRRPWLEIRRLETERTYLEHQLRTLRRLHPAPLTVVRDQLQGPSVYDLERVQLQSEQLWPAYELLCPRDHRRISPQVLAVAGLRGLASLWCDRGVRKRRVGSINLISDAIELEQVRAWSEAIGHPATVRQVSPVRFTLSWEGEALRQLTLAIRPLMHPSRRHLLLPPKPKPRATRMKL